MMSQRWVSKQRTTVVCERHVTQFIEHDRVLVEQPVGMLTAVGFATALLGLAVIMPWLACATWHAYRETLDASAWPGIA